MRLSDCISGETLRKLTAAHIEIGNVYKAPMDASNRITPHGDDTYRPKYFIVLGVDDDGTLYGGVVVNSGVNKNISLTKQDYHYPISCSKYAFLEHDSFVNCADLKPLELDKLLLGTYSGDIETDDLELITGAVIESPFNDEATLKRFHLL